jgi:hypothetical protein
MRWFARDAARTDFASRPMIEEYRPLMSSVWKALMAIEPPTTMLSRAKQIRTLCRMRMWDSVTADLLAQAFG